MKQEEKIKLQKKLEDQKNVWWLSDNYLQGKDCKGRAREFGFKCVDHAKNFETRARFDEHMRFEHSECVLFKYLSIEHKRKTIKYYNELYS